MTGLAQLRASEIQYRRLFESAQDGILILDAETGAIGAANPFLARLLGYSEQELLGKKLWELGPFKDKWASEIAFQELKTHEYIRYDDLPLEAKDGRSVDVEFVSNVYVADDKKVIQCNIRDITARKQTEARLLAILEATPDLVGMADADGRVVYLNRGGRQMLGLVGSPDLASFNLRDFYDAVNSAVVLTEGIPTAIREGHWIGETEIVALNGHVTTVSQVILVHKATDGTMVSTSTIARDITERKRADASQRLQSAALRAAADSIVITDRSGVIEWVNPAFTELTGYAAEEALGKHHRDLVKSGQHTQAFYKNLWDTILAGRTWRGQIINRRKDGGLHTDAQAVTPIMSESGAITHFVAVQEDITERLQLEAQFRQAQKMEIVGQLASGVAHDFNNLLTVINGSAALVLEEISQDHPARTDVQEILRAGERAAVLTRQLLAFSRQQVLAPRVLNVNTVVTGIESLLRRLLGEDIDLALLLTPDAPSIKADPGQMEQVLTNLAVNARDAMPQGGHLTIETQNVTIDEASAHPFGEGVPPGSYVRLAVGDSGLGMDEATRARIFEPFFTTKGPGKGTGLGLSTVHGIVKQSEGFIRVYSEVGKGTSVTIYLPRVTAAPGADRHGPPVLSTCGTETILLVEDNPGLRKLATRFLEPAGYAVIAASTGEEALLLLAQHPAPVHLLLTDVVLPGISGRLLAEQLAQTHPRIKVLYMSGYTNDTIVRHGVLEARVSFLDKPFSAEALLRKVREVLGSDA